MRTARVSRLRCTHPGALDERREQPRPERTAYVRTPLRPIETPPRERASPPAQRADVDVQTRQPTQPFALQRTSVLDTLEDLMACVPGLGSEVTEDGSLVDVRGRYHPGWCAPRVVSSTPAEITRTFDALFSGQLPVGITVTEVAGQARHDTETKDHRPYRHER
jgi:hypothetical protein